MEQTKLVFIGRKRACLINTPKNVICNIVLALKDLYYPFDILYVFFLHPGVENLSQPDESRETLDDSLTRKEI